jgi:hypothetical protein
MTYDQAVAYLKALHFSDYNDFDVFALMGPPLTVIGEDTYNPNDVSLEECIKGNDRNCGAE